MSLTGDAFACLGPKVEYNLGFVENSDGNLVVQLNSEWTPLGGGAEQNHSSKILDDDGFLSAHLAYVKMSKENKNPPDRRILVFFFDQLERFRAYLPAAKKQIEADMKKYPEKLDILIQKSRTIGDVQDAVTDLLSRRNKNPAMLYDLAPFTKVRLYGQFAGYEVISSTNRSSGFTKLWDIDMPSEHVGKSLGCDSAIDGFNTNKNPPNRTNKTKEESFSFGIN
ncbi:MAG: hypothetical protein COT74_12400 [Bdellovibrionales bacterium CG10_big_fil_rev_8_21_14_0_10_45_34]|nr:MAG: hypothetical protein COT74_12400 [Bdellovibrionales bacterium CG10_big_fil_rev_8_21_14_0_10_45_34]